MQLRPNNLLPINIKFNVCTCILRCVTETRAFLLRVVAGPLPQPFPLYFPTSTSPPNTMHLPTSIPRSLPRSPSYRPRIEPSAIFTHRENEKAIGWSDRCRRRSLAFVAERWGIESRHLGPSWHFLDREKGVPPWQGAAEKV